MTQSSPEAKRKYRLSERGREGRRLHYEKNKEKYVAYERNRQYQKMYGITVADYDRMLAEQGGVCKICGTGQAKTRGNKYFAVDHCHRTGQVRGLLCSTCNVAVGFYEVHAARVIEYLAGTQAQA